MKRRKARELSGKEAMAMKRKAQARDHALVASGAVPPESMFLIQPGQAARARVKRWPSLRSGLRKP